MSKLDNFFTAPISSRTIAFACAEPKRTKCFSCMNPFQGIVRVGGGQTRAVGVFHAYTMSLFILGMWCPRSPQQFFSISQGDALCCRREPAKPRAPLIDPRLVF